MRRKLPLFICFFMGVVMIIQTFVPHENSQIFQQTVNDWSIIIGVFFMVLGLYSLFSVHIRKIKRKTKDWWLSYVVIVTLVITALVGLIGGAYNPTPLTKRLLYKSVEGEHLKFDDDGMAKLSNMPIGGDVDYPINVTDVATGTKLEINKDYEVNFNRGAIKVLSDSVTEVNVNYYWKATEQDTFLMMIFRHIQIPMQSTMFSLLAFFVASASFRAFKARNVEAALLLVTAFVVMLGRVPLGAKIYSGLPGIVEWIMMYPNLAAQRGIGLGVGLGVIGTSLKIILGIERGWLGGGD